MATGTFTDSTSSNGMKDNWVTSISYKTTRYTGYTMVEASLKLTTTYNWGAVLNNSYSLTINGDKVTGSGKSVPSDGTVTLLTHKVKVTHTSDKKITISASVNANNIYYNSGGYYIGTYSPSGSVTLKPLPTACVAPTSFSATPNPFTTDVKLSWSGAKGGTANAISSYYIQYCTSSNNSTWTEWTKLTTIASTSTSGSKTIDVSEKVKNNYYIKFRIKTLGEAGDDYYSGYKTANSNTGIQRKYYTACSAPTTFTVSPATFESTVTLSWSGAGGGTNNGISKYNIRYAISKDGSSWGSAIDLPTTTKTSYEVDLSSVTRGYYVRFAIQTEGSAGSSYASSWKYSSSIRRNPYTRCSAPTTFTVTADKSNTDGDFVTTVTFAWSGASAGSNNTIKSYLIRYRTSSNGSTWNAYQDLKTVASTATSGSVSVNLSSYVTLGHYVQFAIRTQGSAGSSYYSSFVYANSTTSANARSFKRNPYTACTAPTSVTITSEADTNSVQHTNVFNNQITIAWSGANGGSNNSILRYYIQYCTSSNGSTWSDWTSLQSSNLTPANTTSTTVNVSTLVNRGQYIKVQVRTEGDAGINYYSPYVVSQVIRRNSVPNAPATLNISSPASLEYSKGDNINLSWSASTDNDNNIKSYQLEARITTEGVWGSWTNINNSIASSAVSYIIPSTLSLYNQIDNNEQIQFRIRACDVFGELSSYKTSDIVVRYDITGVTIGINGKWVNCQLYVCTNGQWVEQDVSAGVGGAWVDAYDGT